MPPFVNSQATTALIYSTMNSFLLFLSFTCVGSRPWHIALLVGELRPFIACMNSWLSIAYSSEWLCHNLLIPSIDRHSGLFLLQFRTILNKITINVLWPIFLQTSTSVSVGKYSTIKLPGPSMNAVGFYKKLTVLKVVIALYTPTSILRALVLLLQILANVCGFLC